MVDDQPVYQTPSANRAITFNELDKLPHTPKVNKVQAHIIPVQVQVNEFRNDAPSYSTTSAHSRRSLHDGGGQHHGTEAPNLRLEVPTSIEDPEATMKLIHAMMAAHRAPGWSGW